MKSLMENWKRFLNESAKVWKIEKLPGKAMRKSVYRLVHVPSGMVIPTDYYKTDRNSLKQLINFLESKADELGWDDIGSNNPSEETVASIHTTIINSEFKRDSMKYVAINIGDNQ